MNGTTVHRRIVINESDWQVISTLFELLREGNTCRTGTINDHPFTHVASIARPLKERTDREPRAADVQQYQHPENDRNGSREALQRHQ